MTVNVTMVVVSEPASAHALTTRHEGLPPAVSQRGSQGYSGRYQRSVETQSADGDRVAAVRRRSLNLKLRFGEIDDRDDGIGHGLTTATDEIAQQGQSCNRDKLDQSGAPPCGAGVRSSAQNQRR
jgi:hypothetical protein